MCIISGYVGTKQAAPILIDMMRKEEGLDGGHYTGIATLHEGRIHYRKLEGNLDTLLEMTDAASLPGTVGFLHSRTPGDPTFVDRWAHPFTCEKNGEVLTALIANGIYGCRADIVKENGTKIAEKLLDAGYELKSVIDYKKSGIPTPCGLNAHVSDVIAQYATQLIENGTDTVAALAAGFEDIPLEAVGLFLNKQEPDTISWARNNFPMHVAFCEHGAYLATVPLAFPADAREYQLLPALSSGQVTKDRFTCRPFKNPAFTVAPITPELWTAAYQKFQDALHQGKHNGFSFVFLEDFEPADCTPKNAVNYQVMSHLYKKGVIRIEKTTVPGHNGTTASKYLIYPANDQT